MADASPSSLGTGPAAGMIPVQFGTCCGWFHPAASGDQVVVLCGAIGFEGLAMYRPLRVLAGQLAAAGYGCLRFDYPGTGDSAGSDSEPERLAAWVDSVQQAANWVRETVRPAATVLVGVQFGALLATLAASRMGGIDRLVLMAPIVSGRTYIRSQKAFMTLAAGLTEGTGEDGYLDAPGQRLHPSTVAAIATTDLAKLEGRPAGHVLLMEPPGVERKPFPTRLAALGATVERVPFAGYDAAMRDAHLNEVPQAAFDAVLAWLGPNTARPGLPVPAPAPALAVGGVTERRVQFGAGGHRLAGVLCSPAAPPRLGVLISNTGANPHFGYGRLAVTLARDLADAGVASLRMDMAGAGDSVAAGEDVRPHLFQGDRTAEIRAGVDVLEGLGIRELAALGVCSGAFYSLTGALADRRLQTLVLINQDVFVWGRSGILIDLKNRFAGSRSSETVDQEDGGSELAVRADLKHVHPIRSRIRRLLVDMSAMLERLGGRSFPVRAAETLSKRGARVLFMTGDQDAALHLLEAHFGERAQKLQELPGMTLSVVKGLDHTLGSYASRQLALPIIERYLLDQAAAMAEPSRADTVAA